MSLTVLLSLPPVRRRSTMVDGDVGDEWRAVEDGRPRVGTQDYPPNDSRVSPAYRLLPRRDPDLPSDRDTFGDTLPRSADNEDVPLPLTLSSPSLRFSPHSTHPHPPFSVSPFLIFTSEDSLSPFLSVYVSLFLSFLLSVSGVLLLPTFLSYLPLRPFTGRALSSHH